MFKIENHLKNKNGILHISNCNTLKLAEEFSTPLYIYCEERIRENYRRLKNAFEKYYKKFKIYYAIKSNNNLSILKILKSENANADCSCIEEIQLALGSGFSSENLLYTGNYNSNKELEFALKQKVKINIDDISILKKLLKNDTPNFICCRINPGFGKGSFGLVFAGEDAKFGMTEETALKSYELAKKNGVKNFGIHMMTGSCVLNEDYFKEITEKLLNIAEKIANKLSIQYEFVNIGGGFGITYKPNEKELNIEKTAKGVVEVFKEKAKKIGNPYLFIEPGRYIVGDAGILLAKVHAIKKAKKKFVGVDAGMNTLLRPALYHAYHEILLANNLNAKKEEVVNITGQICENTDIIAKNREMPKIKEGDILAILNCGAYGFSMSSNYNTRVRSAEVLVKNGKYELIREREDISDIIKRQRIARWLR